MIDQPFPLTKCLDATADYPQLAEELRVVAEVMPNAVEAGQATGHRAWEYAMALRAWGEWRTAQPGYQRRWGVLDVGGAGSPFGQILSRGYPQVDCLVVDPHRNTTIEDAGMSPESVDAVFSLSTIEHVADPLAFLTAIHRVLAPGGLLFLTADCWDKDGPDRAHFYWMRERIYTPTTWRDLLGRARELGFRRFGAVDWDYSGAQLYGSYSFISLALTKGAV